MISGFGHIFAVKPSTGGAQGAAAERAVAQSGAGNTQARDTIAKSNQRRAAANLVSAQRGTFRVAVLPQRVGAKKKA